MNAAQADWDDQHGRMPPLNWFERLPLADQQSLAAEYAAKLARMLGPNPINQEDGS